MNFVSKTTKSIEFSTPKLELKMYPGLAVSISNMRSKRYSYLSLYKTVILDHSIIIDPKSTRFISIEPPNLVYRKGTWFKRDKTLDQKGIYTYITDCLREKKSIPIMFNNPKGSKIVIPKGSIGQTIEDIEMISKPKYCVSVNIAFI